MADTGKNKIYQIAADKAEYKRYRRLLSSESFGVEDVNETLLEQGAKDLAKENTVWVIEDESEIRKENSRKLESSMGVRSLKGKGIVNGYRTENTIAVTEDKEITLTATKVYSANEKDFLSETKIKLETIGQTSKALKRRNKKLKLIYVADRGYDDQKIFEEIIANGDNFIIRASHLQRIVSQDGKQKKIEDIDWRGNFRKDFEKLKIKNKIYQNVKTVIRRARIELNDHILHLVQICLRDRKNNDIFDHPMVLITNIMVTADEESFEIYRGYLKRWKIEGVFRFIKETLGWEKFQIRDLKGIKKIVALTYLVAAYFYKLGKGIIKQDFIELLSKIGYGKGEITRKSLIGGLQDLINTARTIKLLKDNCTPKQLLKLCQRLGLDAETTQILSSVI